MEPRPIIHRVGSDLTQSSCKYDIDTHKDDPKLPGVFVFCGSRGSGKTYACVQMCKHFEDQGYTSRTFLISPTCKSNSIYQNLTTLTYNDICENDKFFQLFLQHIIVEVKKDWKEFNDYKAYAKLYVRYRRGDPFLTLKEMYEIEKRGGTPPKPVKRPAHMLIVDDAQGTDLYTTCRKDLMSHCTIKHRHIPISICFLMQSWMGLPRVIRLNGTHFLLYKTNDRRQLEQIYSAFGNHVTWDQFFSMYQTAISEPHGFLYIDTNAKSEESRSRNGFNHYFMNKSTEEK